MPPEAWLITAGILFLLLLTAIVDAFTKEVPDELIFLGLLTVTATQGFFVSWEYAAVNLRWAIALGILLWGINEIWYWKFKRDAIGMGDAKWTMLVVSSFGICPAILSWGIGSAIAVAFISILWIFRKRIDLVPFVPFLFAGLMVALFFPLKI